MFNNSKLINSKHQKYKEVISRPLSSIDKLVDFAIFDIINDPKQEEYIYFPIHGKIMTKESKTTNAPLNKQGILTGACTHGNNESFYIFLCDGKEYKVDATEECFMVNKQIHSLKG